MTDKKKELSFVEKFGFEGQGMPHGISEEDRKKILAMHGRSERLVEAGKLVVGHDETKHNA